MSSSIVAWHNMSSGIGKEVELLEIKYNYEYKYCWKHSNKTLMM